MLYYRPLHAANSIMCMNDFSRSRVLICFSTKLHVATPATTGACDMTWSQYKNCYSFLLLFVCLFVCLFFCLFCFILFFFVVVVVEKMKLHLIFFLFCR